jgi:hypothetical protein
MAAGALGSATLRAGGPAPALSATARLEAPSALPGPDPPVSLIRTIARVAVATTAAAASVALASRPDVCSLRSLRQDSTLQLLESGPRLDPELLRQSAAAGLEGREGLGLATRPVEREHQLAEQALAEGMLPMQGLELRDQLAAVADREIRLEAFLECLQPSVFELLHRLLRELLVLEVGERGAAPEREGLPQQVGSRGRIPPGERLAASAEEVLEAVEVQFARLHTQGVARRPPREPILPENLAQPRNVVVERVSRGRRRPLPPQPVDQAVTGYDLVSPQQQDRQQGPLLRPAKRLVATVAMYHQRAEYPELHAS